MTFSAYSAVAVALLLLAKASTVSASDEVARDWFQRMFEVLEKRNYEGRFFFVHAGNSDEIRIVHRVDRGRATERLVFVDDGREVISNDAEIVTYLPRIQTAIVGERNGGPLLAPLSKHDGQFEANYDVELGRASKALSRRTQLIVVKPRDRLRYGYRIWLDHETAMPLKWQVHDAKGVVVEQVLFAEVHFRDRISPDALKPGIPTDGLTWIRQHAGPQNPRGPDVRWPREASPVVGFRLVTRRVRVMPGQVSSSVTQLVFSDGLAAVSVFIEPSNSDESQLAPGLKRVGAAFVYSRRLDGHEVTAVSTEVPPQTLRLIAEGVMKLGFARGSRNPQP